MDTYLDKIRDAGVVGAGGAGFPTHVKLNSKPDTVIANCIECEPLIHADKTLIAREADRILDGLRTAGVVTGAKRLCVGVKGHSAEAVAALEKAIGTAKDVELCLIENYYPAGDEQQLIYEITGRRVPPGGLPIHAGCVVCNAATLFNISNACGGVPVTRRMVTVTGAVVRPFTANVPVGTPISYLLDLAGGCVYDNCRVLLGGPLMGRVSPDAANEFVTKTTNGVIALPEDHVLLTIKTASLQHQMKIAKSACCQCSQCTLVCSRNNLGLGVRPHIIMRALTLDNAGALGDGQDAMDCCDCGLCTYVGCSMGLTPGRFVMEMKRALSAKGIKADKDRIFDVNPMRDSVKVPVGRIMARLDLNQYDRDAPYLEPADPRAVRIQLRQHIGAACVPTVSVGDRVSAGDPVGKVPDKALGAPVHASINGKVTAVTPQFVDIMAE